MVSDAWMEAQNRASQSPLFAWALETPVSWVVGFEAHASETARTLCVSQERMLPLLIWHYLLAGGQPWQTRGLLRQ